MNCTKTNQRLARGPERTSSEASDGTGLRPYGPQPAFSFPGDHATRAFSGVPARVAALIMLFLATITTAGPVHAQALEFTEEQQRVNPVPWMQLLNNEDGRLDLENARAATGSWEPVSAERINLGIGYHDWWFRLPLRNATDEARDLVLEIPYAALDHISMHVLDNGEAVAEYRMGSDYPFDQRPVEHHYFLAPLTLPAGEEQTLYINVRQNGAMRVPLELWTPAAFLNHDQLRQLLTGIYFGGMLVIVLYNLFMFLGVRDWSYLLYTLFVLSLPLFVSSLQGYSLQYLWPNAPEWNARSIGFFLTTTVFFGILFTADFLELRRPGIWSAVRNGLRLLLAFCALMLMMVFFAPYLPMLATVVAGSVIACALALFVGIYSWYKHYRWARYYILAWSALLLGGIVFAASVASLLPVNVITTNAVPIGSVLLVILLSLAMADRINQERLERQQAQERALSSEREAKMGLERKVRERTRELETLNTRLEELSERDELTGLKNRRFLDQSLHREYLRSSDFQRPVSLILLDIDHFKHLNDTFGHPAGDECLRNMGALLRESVPRQSDIVARYGGEEFCVLLPETDLRGATTVAERIRANVEDFVFMVEGRERALTVSAGVATLNAIAEGGPQQLLELADKALYEAKHQGRNRVVTARPEDSSDFSTEEPA